MSDAEKRAFDKLVDKLDDAKDMALNTDSTIEDARRYVEAHEAIRTYEQFAAQYIGDTSAAFSLIAKEERAHLSGLVEQLADGV